MLTKPLLHVENIEKSFISSEGQELLVLDNINFQLEAGEIVAFLGKSGSGKSTFLRIIAGLISASKGSVSFKDKKVTGIKFKAKKRYKVKFGHRQIMTEVEITKIA